MAPMRWCRQSWQEATWLIAPITLEPLIVAGGPEACCANCTAAANHDQCDEPCGLLPQAVALARLLQCTTGSLAVSSGTGVIPISVMSHMASCCEQMHWL